MLEKRNHVGGNCYDEKDSYGVLIHLYGPHIFHTDREQVWEFLSRFTGWKHFQHEVKAKTNEGLIPVPFNLNTLHLVFGEEADRVEKKLINSYGQGTKVPVLKLLQTSDQDLREIGEYVYENIYLHYTMKQWGKKPEEIDKSVTARVPVKVAYDNGYFTNKYQAVPEEGFTVLFENMLDHPNITVQTGTSLEDCTEVQNGQIYYAGDKFEGKVIFTGALDELFGCKYGRLPYRTLDIEFEHIEKESYQGVPVVNYTVSEAFTRITEYKFLTRQKIDGTTISREYPRVDEAKHIKNFYVLGRLAEYKYYDIDAITEKAIELSRELLEEELWKY